MTTRLLNSSRIALIGRTIGNYLLGMAGGLFLARFVGEPAMLGFVLAGLGSVTISVFALRNVRA